VHARTHFSPAARFSPAASLTKQGGGRDRQSLTLTFAVARACFSFNSALRWIACARGKQRSHHRRELWISHGMAAPPRPAGDGPVQRERSEASSVRSLTCRPRLPGTSGHGWNVGRAMMGKRTRKRKHVKVSLSPSQSPPCLIWRREFAGFPSLSGETSCCRLVHERRDTGRRAVKYQIGRHASCLAQCDRKHSV
jgi:hypothetical protein